MRSTSSLVLALVLAGTSCAEQARGQPLKPRLEALAAAGSAEAAYHLGMIHHLGLEGTRDPKKALALFRKAAKAGDPLAAYKLGCYYDGQGDGLIEEDLQLALRYKLVAAEAGYALAQHDVAMLHYRLKNAEQTLAWMNKAAAQGWQQSLMALASLYNVGDGIVQDRAKTLAYFAIAQRMSGEPPSEQQRAWLRSYEQQTSAADQARAQTMAANWRAAPTALTLKALSGQKAAARLVAGTK